MKDMFFQFDYSSSIFYRALANFCSENGPNMNPWQVLLREAYNEGAQVSAHVWERVLACENDNKRERRVRVFVRERGSEGERQRVTIRQKLLWYPSGKLRKALSLHARHGMVVIVVVVVFDRTHILIGRREKDSKAAASGRCSSMPLSLSHFLSHVLEKGINVTIDQTTTITVKNYEWTNEC